MSLANIIRNMQTHLNDAYDALEEKGATIPEAKNLNNLATTVQSVTTGAGGGSEGGGSTGGLEIDGIIEQYYVYAGENISAGTFIEFIRGIANKDSFEGEEFATTPVGITSETSYGPGEDNCDYVTPVLLDDGQRVFISFADGAGQTAGRILKFENGAITYGNKYVICSNSKYKLKLAALSGGRVFAFKAYSDYYYLLGTNDMTISQISRGEVQGNTGVADEVTVLKIDDSHIFVTYNYMYSSSTSQTWGAKVITIAEDGTMTENATPGTSSNGSSSPHFSMNLGNNIIGHALMGLGYLTTWDISHPDTKIERPSNNMSGIIPKASYGDICQIDEIHFLCVYNTSTGELRARMLTVVEKTLAPSNDFIIAEDVSDYTLCACELIPNTTNVLVIYTVLDDEECPIGIRGAVLDCAGGIVNSVLTDTDLNITTDIYNWWGEKLQLISLENNSNNFMLFFGGTLTDDEGAAVDNCAVAQCLYVDHKTNEVRTAYSTSSMTVTYETQVRPVTKAPFYGVAKTSGVGGDDTGHNDMIEVYTL